jgi:hypothetical protein
VFRWRRDVFSRAKRAQAGVFQRQTGANDVFSGAKRAQTMFFERQTGANEVFSSAKRARMGCFRGPNERE